MSISGKPKHHIYIGVYIFNESIHYDIDIIKINSVSLFMAEHEKVTMQNVLFFFYISRKILRQDNKKFTT
jgi:hypothetical protein